MRHEAFLQAAQGMRFLLNKNMEEGCWKRPEQVINLISEYLRMSYAVEFLGLKNVLMMEMPLYTSLLHCYLPHNGYSLGLKFCKEMTS